MQTSLKVIHSVLRSPVFFISVLALFVFESVWIALSARYPMAFDEGYHLSIIQLFSHQWSPLILHQPGGAQPYGDVTRDTSYLYHWLMSYPYRILISNFSFKTTVIVLRIINVTFFTAGLVFFRRLLLKTKAPKALVNVSVLFFVLIPIVPLLAGQINYDNLMILILSVNLLMVVRFRDQLQKKKLNLGLLMAIFSLACLGSLVKFPYLPILTAITLYLIYNLWLFARLPRHRFWRDVSKAWFTMPKVRRLAVAALLIISCGLFIEMYGVNIVKYHNITPQCNQVLSIKRCLNYGPWVRNYQYSLEPKPKNYSPDPVVFMGGWVQGMFLRTLFAINGPGEPASYQNFKPLPLISLATIVVFGLGVLLAGRYHKIIFSRDPVIVMLLFICFSYIISLIAKNYYSYLEFGRLLAINGRYLLPVLLPIMLVIAMAYRQFLSDSRRIMLLGCVLLLFFQGGGAITFIAQSNINWYWPNDRLALHLNQRAQKLLRPVLFDWSGRGPF
jgi:hypothetical protein